MLRRRRFTRKKKTSNGPAASVKAGLPKVSVVIVGINGRKMMITRIIQQAYRLHGETEVIVVTNGFINGTKQMAKRLGDKVIHYDRAIGRGVARSIGAKEASGEIILFIDGARVIPSVQLKPLIHAVESGVDIALNKYSGQTHVNDVAQADLANYALNIALSRPDLHGASMARVPYAINRKALSLIGADLLAVPSKAMAIAILKGLDVRSINETNVASSRHRLKRTRHNTNLMEQGSVDDYGEALQWLIQSTNERGGLTDLSRNRDIVR